MINTAVMDSIELKVFLEAVFLKYGYDFRNYSTASIKRRIRQRMNLAGVLHLAELQHRVLNDRNFFHTLLLDLSVNVTEMFRDPSFYLALRKTVIPILKTYPFVKIWHAGCSTGEEVYSMAILLKEEGLQVDVLPDNSLSRWDPGRRRLRRWLSSCSEDGRPVFLVCGQEGRSWCQR